MQLAPVNGRRVALLGGAVEVVPRSEAGYDWSVGATGAVTWTARINDQVVMTWLMAAGDSPLRVTVPDCYEGPASLFADPGLGVGIIATATRWAPELE